MRNWIKCVAAVQLLAVSTNAVAADMIYMGPCKRADDVMVENNAVNLLQKNRYIAVRKVFDSFQDSDITKRCHGFYYQEMVQKSWNEFYWDTMNFVGSEKLSEEKKDFLASNVNYRYYKYYSDKIYVMNENFHKCSLALEDFVWKNPTEESEIWNNGKRNIVGYYVFRTVKNELPDGNCSIEIQFADFGFYKFDANGVKVPIAFSRGSVLPMRAADESVEDNVASRFGLALSNQTFISNF